MGKNNKKLSKAGEKRVGRAIKKRENKNKEKGKKLYLKAKRKGLTNKTINDVPNEEFENNTNNKLTIDKNKNIFYFIKTYGPIEGIGRYIEIKKIKKGEKLRKDFWEMMGINVVDNEDETTYGNEMIYEYEMTDGDEGIYEDYEYEMTDGDEAIIEDDMYVKNKGLRNWINRKGLINGIIGYYKDREFNKRMDEEQERNAKKWNDELKKYKNKEYIDETYDKDFEQGNEDVKNVDYSASKGYPNFEDEEMKALSKVWEEDKKEIKDNIVEKAKNGFKSIGSKLTTRLTAKKEQKIKMKELRRQAKEGKIKRTSNNKIKRKIVKAVGAVAVAGTILVGLNGLSNGAYSKIVPNNPKQETNLDDNKNFIDENEYKIQPIIVQTEHKAEEEIKLGVQQEQVIVEQESIPKVKLVNFEEELMDIFDDYLGVNSKFKMEKGELTGTARGDGAIGDYTNTGVKDFEVAIIAAYDENNNEYLFDNGETIAQIKEKHPNATLKYAPKVENGSYPIGWDQEEGRVEKALINETLSKLDLTFEQKEDLIKGRETGKIDKNSKTLEDIRQGMKDIMGIEEDDLEL